MVSRRFFSTALLGGAATAALAQQQQHGGSHRPGYGELGYDDTPVLPNQKWRVHDIERPRPPKVTPAAQPGQPPSDAIVLFDGQDLSHWVQKKGTKVQDYSPKWKVENGYMEIVGGTGDMVSKEKFGNAQYHIEWCEPESVSGTSQGRGNSGIIIMEKYEIQVLETYENKTYADGQAGAIYGQWPPMVNPARPAGQWNVYDIIFETPKFQGGQVAKPAFITLIFNGVVVHHHQEVVGPMAHRAIRKYEPHGEEESLLLQDHDPSTHVRYRNIWARRLKGYDVQA